MSAVKRAYHNTIMFRGMIENGELAEETIMKEMLEVIEQLEKELAVMKIKYGESL